MSTLLSAGEPCGNSKVWSCWKVTESSTFTVVPPKLIAMNPPHGDHTAEIIGKVYVAAVVFGSHDIGAPCTTLAKEWACDSYSFRMIDFFGANTSAE